MPPVAAPEVQPALRAGHLQALILASFESCRAALMYGLMMLSTMPRAAPGTMFGFRE